MKCPFCNTELPDDAAFCENCGKKIARPITVDPVSADEETSVPDNGRKNNGNTKYLIAVFSVVIIVIVAISAVIITNLASKINNPVLLSATDSTSASL